MAAVFAELERGARYGCHCAHMLIKDQYSPPAGTISGCARDPVPAGLTARPHPRQPGSSEQRRGD